jgi:hypothetical protein
MNWAIGEFSAHNDALALGFILCCRTPDGMLSVFMSVFSPKYSTSIPA